MGRHSRQDTVELSPPTSDIYGPVGDPVFDELRLLKTDPEAWERRYGRYRDPNRWKYYLGTLVFGVVWFVGGFALCLDDGNPTLGMLGMTVLIPLASPFVAVGWWLHDRHQLDPEGTGRRLTGICWAITLVGLGKKLL